MSDKPDSSEKTEQPTPKKIEDALKKGQSPFSREAPAFASMLAILIVLSLWVGGKAGDFASRLARFHDDAASVDLASDADVLAVLEAAYSASAVFLLPIVVLLAVLGIVAAIAQSPPRIVPERIKPKLERISIQSGFKRVFGSQGLAEFLRAIFKFAVVGGATIFLLAGELPGVVRAIFMDPILIPAQLLSIAVRLVGVISTAIILLVAADLVWTRYKWRKDLMMTQREVKEEFKQSEGDPITRARLRSAQKDRSRRRMVGRVSEATVVIANPTHYAVALHYERGVGGAPTVVAKGVDKVALKIRTVAEDSDVPVVEDPPLARALYAAVEVDRTIPEEFYRAVAHVLHFLYTQDAAVRASRG